MYLMSNILFLFTRGFGLLPIKEISGPNGKTSLVVANFYCLLGFTLAALLTCGCFLINLGLYLNADVVFHTLPNEGLIRSTTSLTTEIITINVCYLNAIVSICSAIFGARKIIIFIQKLTDIDFKLQKSNYQDLKMFNRLWGLIITIYLVSCYYEIYRNDSAFYNINSFILTVGYSLIEIIQFFGKVLFLHIVLNIRARFKILNCRVAQILQNDKKKNILNTLSFTVVEDLKANSLPGLYLSIGSLKDIHWILCENIHTTNNIFGYQLLTSTLSTFIQLINEPYFCYLSIIYSSGIDGIRNVIFRLLWISSDFLQFFFAAWYCTSTVDEMKKTIAIASRLLSQDITPTMFKQLESFIHQLSHRNVEFTACGMFTLKMSLLLTAVGVVVTYLSILIQFQESSG